MGKKRHGHNNPKNPIRKKTCMNAMSEEGSNSGPSARKAALHQLTYAALRTRGNYTTLNVCT